MAGEAEPIPSTSRGGGLKRALVGGQHSTAGAKVPREDGIDRETAEAKEVGCRENVTTHLTTPRLNIERLLTYSNTTWSYTFRNRHFITIPGYCDSASNIESAAFVINTRLLEPFLMRYDYTTKTVRINPGYTNGCDLMSFGQLRIKVSRFMPTLRQSTGTGATSVDQVRFDNAPYCLVGIGQAGIPQSLTPCTSANNKKHSQWLIKKGGFYIANLNVLDLPIVKTLNPGAEFHWSVDIPNPPSKYYWDTPVLDLENNSLDDRHQGAAEPLLDPFHYLPSDVNGQSWLNGAQENYQPPPPNCVPLILQVPHIDVFGEATERVFMHGTAILETELDCYFHTTPDYIRMNDLVQWRQSNTLQLHTYPMTTPNDAGLQLPTPIYYQATLK